MGSPEREHLADLLAGVAPSAPTLCEGWTARDLAVHLLVREGRPDAAVAGLAAAAAPRALARAGAHAERVGAALAARPYEDLVARFRAGPPRWSPFAVPAVEAAANGTEFYIHGEDVRRAAPGWDPGAPDDADDGALRPGQREVLWRALRRTARLAYRRSPVGVVLAVPAGPQTTAVRGGRSVVVTGQPEELVLHSSGRGAVARVRVDGDPGAVAELARTRLGL